MNRRLVLVSLMVLAFPTWSASDFVRVPLGQGASIEVPKNWSTISGNQRMTIDAAVEAKGFRLTESTLNFAANVFDDQGKTMAIVNARFYPDNPATQEQAKQLGPSEVKTIDAGMRGAVDAPLKSMGQHMTRWYGSKMQVINGLHVYVHEHQVSGGPGAGPTRIRGMRVWASPRSFTVTLSYRERDATLLLPIINRMAKSIQLD